MRSKLLKTIAILVIIVMVFELTPSIVLGVQKAYADEATKVTVEEATKITNGFPEPPLIDEGLREPATIIGENVSKRTLNEKHYILDNGAMLAAVYPSNVHYEKNGELVDIDNTLIQAENTNEYTNKDNDFKVNLAKQTTNGNLIKIEKNGHKVSWSLAEKQPVKKIALQPQTLQNQSIQRENANELSNQANVKTEVIGKVDTVEKLETINISEAKISTEKINMNKAKINTNDEKMQLEKINSSVKYAAILNGVDLKYDIASNSIKESIILRNKNQICTEFTFNLETNGLKARLEKDKTVILYNEKTNEDVFIIEAPYMFDSKLEYSDDIEVELLEKNGKYQLIIKPEEEWLIAEERAYPVTIDPTVSTSLEREKIKDTYVYDGDTNNNTRGNAHIIRIGNSKWLGPNGGNPVRGLIKFELPKLDAGDQVIYATLGISNYPKTSEWTPPTRELQIDVHKMTANWDENTAHWSNTNTNYDTRIADYILYQYNSSTPNTCYEKVFDITAIAKDWYTTGNNYGVMLKEHTEQRGYTAQSDAYFVSSDTATTYINARPQVMIEYRNQTGVENYLSYHEQNVGRAGTIYTNDYNGNLVLLHGDLSTPGNRMPVGINHVFNTNDKSTDIGYGKGYRLNLSQTINPKTIGGTAYLRYVDEDGTAHYFKKPSGASHYEDEDGLGLKITLANNIYTMEDKKGNKSTFSKHKSKDVWYLTKIQDTNGNAITLTLTYTGSNEWVVSQVTDAVGDKLTLTYSGNRLANIKDPAGKTVTYTYNSNGNLTQITYPDGLKSNYVYSDNKLTSVQNIDNSKVQYEYYVEKTSRVKTIKEYGTDGVVGNTLTITYGSDTTIFTDNRGESNVYVFNNLGEVTSIGDLGKNVKHVKTAYGKNFEYGSGNNKHNMTLESNLMSVSEMTNNLVKNGNFTDGLTNWTKQNSNTNDKVLSYNGDNAYKITGAAKTLKNVVQTINISGKKGDVFTTAGWVQTLGTPHGTEKSSSVRITVSVVRNDDSIQWIPGLYPSAATSGWQFLSGQFSPDSDYKQIGIYLCCYNNANDTYFDNVGIFKEEFGASYAYDANGNMISTRDQAKNSSTFEYNENSNILKSITPKGGKYEYVYDFKTGNLKQATNAMGQKYSFGYDSYGNQKTAKIEESPKTDELVNNNTYNMKVLGSAKSFDINQGNSMTLEQHDFHGGSNQKFTFQQISGENYYRIIPNNDTGKSLELNTTTNKIQQMATANKDTQKWQLTKNADGTYRISNKQKGNAFVMTLENDRSDSGIAIKVEKWLNKSNQKILIYNTNSQFDIRDEEVVQSNAVYRIRAKNSNLYLQQQNTTQGSAIIQSAYSKNNLNQLWRIVRVDGENKYKLVNMGSAYGYVIDVVKGNNTSGNAVQMWDNTIPNTAQEWGVIKNSDGTYNIQSCLSGTTSWLTVTSGAKTPGTKMCITPKGSADSQKFYLEKTDRFAIEAGATYKIKSKVSNLYATVNTNGNVEQQASNNSNNQKWTVKDLKNGYYELIPKSDTGKRLDLHLSKIDNGNNIKTAVSSGVHAQQFELVASLDGTYYIKPRLGKGKTSVDVADASKEAGANIQNWESNVSDAQKFYFEKTENAQAKKYIQESAEYTSNGKFKTKDIDQAGNATTYTYNNTTGTLTKVTNAKQAATQYTYDNIDRLTKVEQTANGKVYNNQYTYEKDRLKTISHNGFNYQFIYDNFGNTKQVKVGNATLITNNYEANNGNLTSITYGNNQTISYTRDRFNRITKTTTPAGTYEYSYDAKSNLKQAKDNVNSITETYKYDLSDRLVERNIANGLKSQYTYDKNNNVNKITTTLNNANEGTTTYWYDRDNRINYIDFGVSRLLRVNYDRLSRITDKTLDANGKTYVTKYQYKNTSTTNKTTTLLESVQNGTKAAIKYTYDALGNIETITEGTTLKQKYYYDALNQLIREDNKDLNKTITYEYDTGGNILNKKEYAYTTGTTLQNPTSVVEYVYGNTNWKDQLTSYNGKAITYDAIGNPLTYDGNTYTWKNGRELGRIQNTSKNTDISYKYNDSGIRIEKTVNGTTTKYHLDGTKVIYEQTGNDMTRYMYDENNQVVGMDNNGSIYYLVRNGQGDVIGLLDNNLNEVARYTYDSWGKLILVTNSAGKAITDTNNIAHKNPYRYRGYRYDAETGLYYLQSRYYNPEWSRFVNADGLVSTGQGMFSHNMYAYCENNPINYYDNTGMILKSVISSLARKFVQTLYNTVMFVVENIDIGTSVSVNKQSDLSRTPIGTFEIETRGIVTSKNINSNKSIKVNLDISNNRLAKSEISFKKSIFNFSLNIEKDNVSASAGVTTKNDTYSLGVGKKSGSSYLGITYNKYINEYNQYEFSERYTMNPLLPAIAIGFGVGATYGIPIPLILQTAPSR